MIFKVEEAEIIGSVLILKLKDTEVGVLTTAGLALPHIDGSGDFINVDLVKIRLDENKNIKEFVDKWRELFPEKKNPNTGRYFRGERQGCIDNMKKFMRKYDYTEEVIIQATKNALEEFSPKGYFTFPQAHYFIEKDRNSMLAQYCENVGDKSTSGDIGKRYL